MHDYLHIVDAPLEHEWTHTYRVHLVGHQRVPSREGEDVVREVSRRVDALGPVQICYTLQRGATGERAGYQIHYLKISELGYIKTDQCVHN